MRGSKPGERRGGRQCGTKNKLTLVREHAQLVAAQKIAGALGAEAFAGDAHGLLVSVYKDPTQPLDLRIDAAKAALPFEKPRLSTINGRVDANFSLGDLIRESMALESGCEVLTIDAVRSGGAN